MRLASIICLFISFTTFGQEIFKSIEDTQGRESEVYHLELSGKKYSEIPQQVRQFENLRSLIVKRAGLKTLPDWLGELPIEKLCLVRNKMDEFPLVITELTELKFLNLGHNFLNSIPPEIKNLKQLEFFNLWANEIYEYPIELQQLTSLKELNLRSMDLNRHEQDELNNMLPNVKLNMSPPCNCN